ncbi:MAG: hypothetical protein ACREIF_00530 [Chthoniobacterales bacterium]
MKDDLVTVIAVGVLAFIAVDIAHEVVGHGIGLLLSGGRAGILTTTRLISDVPRPGQSWRIFDLGGPAGNLSWAALCLVLQRFQRGAAPRWRLFLWASAMFSLFWEFGYLMKCGLTGSGDYMALILGLKPAAVWRALLFLAGLMLYRAAIRLLTSDLHFVVRSADSGCRTRVTRLLWALYLAGGLAACAGAILDPRGPGEIFNSGALSSFVACLGLAFVPGLFGSYPDKSLAVGESVSRSAPITALAVLALLLFVLVLGRGIPVSV